MESRLSRQTLWQVWSTAVEGRWGRTEAVGGADVHLKEPPPRPLNAFAEVCGCASADCPAAPGPRGGPKMATAVNNTIAQCDLCMSERSGMKVCCMTCLMASYTHRRLQVDSA